MGRAFNGRLMRKCPGVNGWMASGSVEVTGSSGLELSMALTLMSTVSS